MVYIYLFILNFSDKSKLNSSKLNLKNFEKKKKTNKILNYFNKVFIIPVSFCSILMIIFLKDLHKNYFNITFINLNSEQQNFIKKYNDDYEKINNFIFFGYFINENIIEKELNFEEIEKKEIYKKKQKKTNKKKNISDENEKEYRFDIVSKIEKQKIQSIEKLFVLIEVNIENISIKEECISLKDKYFSNLFGKKEDDISISLSESINNFLKICYLNKTNGNLLKISDFQDETILEKSFQTNLRRNLNVFLTKDKFSEYNLKNFKEGDIVIPVNQQTLKKVFNKYKIKIQEQNTKYPKINLIIKTLKYYEENILEKYLDFNINLKEIHKEIINDNRLFERSIKTNYNRAGKILPNFEKNKNKIKMSAENFIEKFKINEFKLTQIFLSITDLKFFEKFCIDKEKIDFYYLDREIIKK